LRGAELLLGSIQSELFFFSGGDYNVKDRNQ